MQIDYKNNSSELCEIGKKYDTDKSSQRNNITNFRHCHPYTLIYNSLFKHKRFDTLEIAELGILDGASLQMWLEYFPNSHITGFEYNWNLIIKFLMNSDNKRIKLSHINVEIKENIQNEFKRINKKFDIIIDDTTHHFEDQIRIIENVFEYLKPGGILIIEDIFKSYNEKDYINRLSHILHHFQDYYFVTLDHTNRNSVGWDNDKLFILIKNEAPPIFKNPHKMTIITPCCRPNNLYKVKESINFDYVNEWIIVYDGNKLKENPLLFRDNSKIREYIYDGSTEGISGNPQRNFALKNINNTNTYIYYLDDDNIIHPNLYKLLDIIDDNKLYTFNQENGIKGDCPEVFKIDTAMLLIDYNLCKDIFWEPMLYQADGIYISSCYNKNKNKHIYVNNDLCYYNYLVSK